MNKVYEDKTPAEIKQSIEDLIIINNVTKISMNDLIFEKLLGEGGQSQVYQGYYGREECAIKIFKSIDYKNFMSELVIISNLKHRCIPKFFGIIDDNKKFGIVIEYIDGITLDSLKPNELNEELKIKIITEIGLVLEYLHANNIIHRDLKPGNIMIDKLNNIYLIDYGISKICINKKNILVLTKGTLNYLAPECMEVQNITENEEAISLITSKVDVWSYGCLINYILSGEIPWDTDLKNNDLSQYKKLVFTKEFPISTSIDPNNKLYEIIKLATIVEPNHRISMKEINDILYKYFYDCAEDKTNTFIDKNV